MEQLSFEIWSKSDDSKVVQGKTHTETAQQSPKAIILSAKVNDHKAVQPANEGTEFRNVT
jgi:hypothetical protein